MEAAPTAFEQGNYGRALTQLLSNPPPTTVGQRQYQHNVAIVDHITSGATNTTSLLRSLEKFDNATVDNVDRRAAIRYNRAVLHVRLCQFPQAVRLLRPVYDSRSDFDVDLGLSVKLAILLLEIFVRMWDVAEAEAIIDDLISIRARLMSSEPITSCTPMISINELSFYIHLFQTRISLLVRNEKAAKKTAKLAMQLLNKDSATSSADTFTDYHKASALLVKARLECLGEKYIKAIKLLNNVQFACPKDPRVALVYLNSLGCLHFAMGRYHAASFYLQRALKEPACNQPALRLQIRFNQGLQQLYAGGAATLDLASNAVLFPRSPWMWMQLGSSAIHEYASYRTQQLLVAHRSPFSQSSPRLSLAALKRVPDAIVENLHRGYTFYRNAIQLSSSHQVAFLGIAFICLALNRFSECLAWLTRISSAESMVVAILYRTEALCSLNRYHEAMECLKQILPKASDNLSDEDVAAIFSSMSICHFLADDPQSALIAAAKAHMVQPNDHHVLRTIIYLLMRYNARNEAEFATYHRTPPPTLSYR